MSGHVKPLYVDLPNVASMVALATATIQRMVRENEFPRPRQLSGRRVGWLMREVEAWAEERPVSDLPHHPTLGGGRASRAHQRLQIPSHASNSLA